jgi:hypothetical protein
MKLKYALLISIILLSLTPLFSINNMSRLVFQIVCLIIFSVCAFLAWKQNKINALVAYSFLLIINIIQIFDKEDKYFFVQIILLGILIIYAFIEWQKKNKKSGID